MAPDKRRTVLELFSRGALSTFLYGGQCFPREVTRDKIESSGKNGLLKDDQKLQTAENKGEV